MGKLTDAIFEGNTKQVETLLNRSPIFGGYKGSREISAEKATQEGCIDASPLFLACTLGRSEIVKLLLEAGAEIRKDENPFFAAAINNHVEVLKLLTDEFGNEVDAPRELDKSSALIIAARLGKEEAVKFLIENKVSPINKKNNIGETALYAATESNHVSIVKFLIKHGANIHSTTVCQRTPYTLAMKLGSDEMKQVYHDYQKDLKARLDKLDNLSQQLYEKIGRINKKREKILELLKQNTLEGVGVQDNAGIFNAYQSFVANYEPSAPRVEGVHLKPSPVNPESLDLIDLFTDISPSTI